MDPTQIKENVGRISKYFVSPQADLKCFFMNFQILDVLKNLMQKLPYFSQKCELVTNIWAPNQSQMKKKDM